MLQAYATTGGAELSASQQHEEEQKSGRASKSLSPRKVSSAQAAIAASASTMKGSGMVSVSATPALNMDDLRSKFNQVMEENKQLKREIQSQQQ